MEPGQAWVAANPAASHLPRENNAIHVGTSRVADQPAGEVVGSVQNATPSPHPRRVAVLGGGLHGSRSDRPVAAVNAGPHPVRFASTRAIAGGPVVRRAAVAVSFLAGMGIEKYLIH